LFAVLVFLVAVPQGQDVVRALAERQSGSLDDWQRIFFFAGVLAWAIYAWYWARVMLRLAFPGVPGNVPELRRFRTWMPRILGTLATLGVAAALYRASLGYAEDEHAAVRELLVDLAQWTLAGAAAFFVTVTYRRPVLRLVRLDVKASGEEAYGSVEFRDLGWATLGSLAAALLVAVVLLGVFVFWLQEGAVRVGTAAILLLAATGWIAAGSTLDFIGMRKRIPVFLGLLALAIVFSPWNDNHAVRTLETAQPDPRDDLRDLLRAWLARQPAKERGALPLYVLNAEGGGIRAAWWTASVLGEIQGMLPGFDQQLFSLSAVSGGSLGAGVYAALLAEQRAGRNFILKQKAQAILGEDFLSPVAAAMLYPDLLQRVLPLPVARFDRALALEEAWELAWRKHMPESDRFAEPMDRVRDGKSWAPLLFLNATWVETGKRIVASQASIEPRDGSVDFVDTEDAQRFFAPRSLRLSTAVHMSARFTYISPAGTLKRSGEVHGHVVDGGYFENSAATTTLEILKTIGAMADDESEDPRWKRVEPLVIHISNEPVNPLLAPETLAGAPGHPRIGPNAWMNELLSPLWTLLNARGARGTYARETVRFHVGAENFLHFGLCRESTNVPLGWVLSSSTRRNMNSQLAGQRCETRDARVIFDNRDNLERLRSRQGG